MATESTTRLHLQAADIGIAIGAGTDIAIDAADIVLMKSRLLDVPAAIRLSRATLRNIHGKFVLGIYLQCYWHPSCSRSIYKHTWLAVESYVCSRSNELVQL